MGHGIWAQQNWRKERVFHICGRSIFIPSFGHKQGSMSHHLAPRCPLTWEKSASTWTKAGWKERKDPPTQGKGEGACSFLCIDPCFLPSLLVLDHVNFFIQVEDWTLPGAVSIPISAPTTPFLSGEFNHSCHPLATIPEAQPHVSSHRREKAGVALSGHNLSSGDTICSNMQDILF